jgi:hypothetical protein
MAKTFRTSRRALAKKRGAEAPLKNTFTPKEEEKGESLGQGAEAVPSA